MLWTLAAAKTDFQRGLLTGWEIQSVPMEGKLYLVRLKSRLGVDGDGELVDAHNKEVRRFKTLDAAVAAVCSIGFTVSVLRPG